MIHAIKEVASPPLMSQEGAETRTFCGLEGRMREWHSAESNFMVADRRSIQVVKPFVDWEIRSQGKVVGMTAKLNPAITCEACKNLIMANP